VNEATVIAGTLEAFDLASWDAPVAPEVSRRAVEVLEGGRTLFLPSLAFPLLPGEHEFLRDVAADRSRKNISFDPATGRCHGSSAAGEALGRLVALLDRFGRSAETLLRALAPGYGPTLERARASLRPLEIACRSYSLRQDDRLLHVDAFPTRPTRGRRILRVFTNVAPDGAARRWRVGEDFADYAQRFLPRVRRMMPGEAWLRQTLHLTRSRRTEYDHLMLGLHDAGKRDTEWQRGGPFTEIDFPAGSSWMCFTDLVPHAALAGHGALEQTFHVPVEAMAAPELAPLRVLERLTGRALV
jgi:3-deoxy-D-manno-oct-2-ulosonic acid (Kdo) hydroxylase